MTSPSGRSSVPDTAGRAPGACRQRLTRPRGRGTTSCQDHVPRRSIRRRRRQRVLVGCDVFVPVACAPRGRRARTSSAWWGSSRRAWNRSRCSSLSMYRKNLTTVAVGVQVVLEVDDLVVASAPDGLRNEIVHADDEDVLVVRAVEDAHLALARDPLGGSATGSRASLLGRRRLELATGQPCGLNAVMTLRIVPSLPAASIPCRTMSTARWCSAHTRPGASEAVEQAVGDDLRRVLLEAERRAGVHAAEIEIAGRATRAANHAGSVPGTRCLLRGFDRARLHSMPPYPRRTCMTAVTGTKPHPIFLAGRWVESPRSARRRQPGRRPAPAGSTFNATPEQYEEAVQAAVAAFPGHPRAAGLRAGAHPPRDQRRAQGTPGGAGPAHRARVGKPVRDALVEVDRATLTFRLGAEEAERIFGETIPLDLMPASRGRIGIRALPDRSDRRDQPVQLPAEPRRAQGRAGDRSATRSC